MENLTSHNNLNQCPINAISLWKYSWDISNSIVKSFKLPTTVFSTKIPNLKALWDFFYNHCKKYFLSYSDLPAGFAKEVLAWRKFLLNMEQVRFVDVSDNLKSSRPRTFGYRSKTIQYLSSTYILNTLRPYSVIATERN